MTETLKPCPFCGSKNIDIWSVKLMANNNLYYAVCFPEKDNEGKIIKDKIKCPYHDLNYAFTKEEAITMWNTRAGESK